MLCEGPPGICSNRAGSPKMLRQDVCGSPCGSGMSFLIPLARRFPCSAWRLRVTIADITP
eukprot:9003265-Pyramimonas_sp.AAC.1